MAGHGFELDPIAMKDPGATSTIYMGFEEPMVGDSSVNFSIWVIILCHAPECLQRYSDAFLDEDALRLKPYHK